jgi:hypothetical protein
MKKVDEQDYPRYFEKEDIPIRLELKKGVISGYTWSGHIYPPLNALSEGREIPKDVYDEVVEAYKDYYENKSIDEKKLKAIISQLFGTTFYD